MSPGQGLLVYLKGDELRTYNGATSSLILTLSTEVTSLWAESNVRMFMGGIERGRPPFEAGCSSKDTDYLHVSFDIDSVDPRVAPGTGTTVFGGLTYREAHLAMEMIAESDALTSLELAEVNPILDVHNQTGQLAVDLIASALGKTIL